ncbi:glutathione ABC transporter ATP-binding protein [Rhodococcus sp. 06-412-2C]|uniref:ABC transporter ATP-binding protein n=1 Tax=unclassified Rhodococcus (in: high G+C Gram-positive bacteria) TaxID=192944 RepID=UPI000B9A20ED|nr:MULTISPECIES: ABC transporter ATP-binding protein [unclassified Rhodococcus (in: high G+C Gram-positive bacteria)]OZC84672.1 glutathione ABC transporter ATP-binding protein [Rhodococcus sp. 06-412-2C]OZC98326.1 glutathione ABC transporter ATP-binding protein [Rhodococcus sp. 06-412-2B]
MSIQKDTVLTVTDLTVEFEVEKVWRKAADSVSFTVAAGEVLAIVGESGSGKSTTAMAIPGLLADNSRVSGSIVLGDKELVGLPEKQLAPIRGKNVAVIFQEPMTALNPVYSIGWQITEAIRAHTSLSKKEAKARAVELLKLVEMPDPETRVDYYPHQLSGGQRQRAMIAQALSSDPSLLIADEPTTALDVTVQAEILDLMRDLRNRIDASIVLITHDMGVVADMADRIAVMKDGVIVETDAAQKIFKDASHPYTQQLLASVPHLGSSIESVAAGTVAEPSAVEDTRALSIVDGVIDYPGRTVFRAVDGVSLDIEMGEVVGLVGESGSGKSTIGKAVVGLNKLTGGSLSIAGVDITKMSNRELRAVRSKVGIVFQDPGSSLNPRWPIGQSIAEPMLLHTELGASERNKKVEELLDQVHLSRTMRNRYPHQLSGGQRQRVGIARALALEPTLLVADEPTSALDVSVQAKVLELFKELQREYGFACLFISHDLAVVEVLAKRIAVLNKGKLAEFGTTDQILRRPTNEYTKRLLAAVPVPDPAEQAKRRQARAELLAAGAK